MIALTGRPQPWLAIGARHRPDVCRTRCAAGSLSRVVENDELFAARLAAGDEEAIADVYDAHGPAVFRVAWRVLGAAASAEDVVQEVFVALWRRPERFSPARGSLRSYLCLQARCRALDALRRASVRSAAEDARADEALREGSDGGDTAATAEASLTAGLVQDAVRLLPPDQREVVELAYFGGRSHTEVAVKLGLPLGTVKGRMRLAHDKLRSLLAPATAVTQ